MHRLRRLPEPDVAEIPGQRSTRGRQGHHSEGERDKSPRRHQQPFVQLPSYQPFLNERHAQTRQRRLDAKVRVGNVICPPVPIRMPVCASQCVHALDVNSCAIRSIADIAVADDLRRKGYTG